MNNADMPAMPVTDECGMFFSDVPPDLCTMGLTKREYFAGIAMGRVIAQDKNGVMGPDITAAAAVILADALLAELGKEAS